MRPFVALAIVLLAASPPPTQGFSHVEVGDTLPNLDLPDPGGRLQPLLGKTKVSVFVFFRPAQEHSLQTLRQLAQLEREFQGRSVHFTAVTSDSYPRDEVLATARDAGIRMPVLIDKGDGLYGLLGVALHPVVGIADASHRLAAYEHFRQVNMLDRMRGQIQLALGEIGPGEMARIAAPPKATTDSPRATAHRRAVLARMLLERGHLEKALENAREAVAVAPSLAEARATLASVLAAARRCDEAEREQAAARALDASVPPLRCPSR